MGWLGRLKNSLRNSRPVRSVKRKFLMAEKSRLAIPGPMMVLRAELP